MSYVDGFLIPMPKNKLALYKKIASQACKVWIEHGALDYKECVGEDLKVKGLVSFSKVAGAKRDEIVVFAYIVYKSRKHRDAVNAQVMKDPRIQKMCNSKSMPFDVRRMAYGGFTVIVEPK